MKQSYTLLGCLLWGSLLASADTLYLKDGSVVTGIVLSQSDEKLVLANPLYGDLMIGRADILYRDGERPDLLERYDISADGTAVIARLQRTVPARKPDQKDASFNLLIPGDVQAATDANGLELPFTQRTLGDNSLVTFFHKDILPGSGPLSITTLQKTLITPTPTGRLAFQADYALNQAQHLRVIVTYPADFRLLSVTPTPDVEFAGLLVWDRRLQRQQRLRAEVLFAP